MKKEVRSIVFEIVYVITIISLVTYLWWGPYQEKLKLNNIKLNQTSSIKTEGFEEVVISKDEVVKELTISNVADSSNSFAIAFTSSNNNNNYILYKIEDEFGNETEVRTLALDGKMLISNILPKSSKQYKIIIWSEDKENLTGNLALITNPVV